MCASGFANGVFGGGSIEAGECATAGVTALLAAKNDPVLWQTLGFGPGSVVRLIGTDGATAPVVYDSMITKGRKT